MLRELSGARVTVMGLGRFGGGAGVTRWLVEQDARVLLTDMQPEEKLREPLAEIADLLKCEGGGGVSLRLGGHDLSDFTPARCDLVIANPAVPQPWKNPFLKAAADNGVPITTEIQLLVDRLNRQRVIGVTGSAGKSTTSAMIHHALNKVGVRAHLGGNIGGSLLNSLDQIGPDDFIVLELSSAMLYWLGEGAGSAGDAEARGWSPHIAVLTNIVPNHIDWHGSFEHYDESKRNIFKWQTPGDHAVVGEDFKGRIAPDVALHRVRQADSQQTTARDGDLHDTISLKIPGRHNRTNARFALVAVRAALAADRTAYQTQLTDALADFPGLPHRLQHVLEINGLNFYNDSKSTTPEATLLAIEAFDDPSRIHLIAGGYDKGSDLAPIARASAKLAKLYTIGETGSAMAAAAPNAEVCHTLDAAVDRAMTCMRPGDVLLLSPGCASWDQFTNYEERGRAFEQMVREKSSTRTPFAPGLLHQGRSGAPVRAGW